jgi:hypothetical protein
MAETCPSRVVAGIDIASSGDDWKTFLVDNAQTNRPVLL